jgi:hypothetical protein
VVAQVIAARIRPESAPRLIQKPQKREGLPWRPALVASVASLLLVASAAARNSASQGTLLDVLRTVTRERLNAFDQETEDRGYYEGLLDRTPSTADWITAPGPQVPDSRK